MPFAMLRTSLFALLLALSTGLCAGLVGPAFADDPPGEPADEPPATAETRPAYPYAVPDWYRTIRGQMKVKLDLDYTNAALARVVADVAKATGATIVIDCAVQPAGINLRVVQLEADSGLRLVTELHGLLVRYSGGKVVVTDNPAKYPEPEHATLLARIEQVRESARRARQQPLVLPEHLTDQALEQRLDAVKVDLEVEFMTLPEAIATLAGQCKFPLRAAPTANKFHRVTLSLKQVTVRDALAKVLEGSRSTTLVCQGEVLVCSDFAAKNMKQVAAENARRRAAIEAALARRVGDVRGLDVRALYARLKAKGLPVVVGAGAWKVDGELPEKMSDDATLGEVLGGLATIGVELVVVPDGERVYLLAAE